MGDGTTRGGDLIVSTVGDGDTAGNGGRRSDKEQTSDLDATTSERSRLRDGSKCEDPRLWRGHKLSFLPPLFLLVILIAAPWVP